MPINRPHTEPSREERQRQREEAQARNAGRAPPVAAPAPAPPAPAIAIDPARFAPRNREESLQDARAIMRSFRDVYSDVAETFTSYFGQSRLDHMIRPVRVEPDNILQSREERLHQRIRVSLDDIAFPKRAHAQKSAYWPRVLRPGDVMEFSVSDGWSVQHLRYINETGRVIEVDTLLDGMVMARNQHASKRALHKAEYSYRGSHADETIF